MLPILSSMRFAVMAAVLLVPATEPYHGSELQEEPPALPFVFHNLGGASAGWICCARPPSAACIKWQRARDCPTCAPCLPPLSDDQPYHPPPPGDGDALNYFSGRPVCDGGVCSFDSSGPQGHDRYRHQSLWGGWGGGGRLPTRPPSPLQPPSRPMGPPPPPPPRPRPNPNRPWGFSYTYPNGFAAGLNGFPNIMNALPNTFPKGLFSGMQSAVMNVPPGLQSSLQGMNVVDANSTKGQQNNTCCFGATCLSPCPVAGGSLLPMPVQMPVPLAPVPPPVIVPARTYYEPVVHHHPPLHKIKKIIRQDRERKRKRHRYDSSADCSAPDTDLDTDSSEDTDSTIDYYDDVINVKV